MLALTLPLAVLTSFFLGASYARKADLESIVAHFRQQKVEKGFIYLPLLTVAALMAGPKILPGAIPDLGLPLIFTLGIILSLFTGKKIRLLNIAGQGVREIMPVVGILTGVGMLIEIMTLTGVRGSIVINTLSIPPYLTLLGLAVSLPIFGGISVYGSASVFGVPFALSMLGQNHIVTISALSLIASMGSFLPPVALTAVVAAQMLGDSDYLKVVRKCLLPGLAAVLAGVFVIVFADPIARIIL
jgi:hypothetical protein